MKGIKYYWIAALNDIPPLLCNNNRGGLKKTKKKQNLGLSVNLSLHQ